MASYLRNYSLAFTGLSRESWIVSILILINRATFMAVPFMGLYVTQYLHRQPADAGALFTAFGAGSIAGSLLGGRLTDMIGFRKVQIIFISLGGLCLLIFPGIQDLKGLLVLTLITGFFVDGFRPANFTATAAYAAPGTLVRAYALNRMASNVGWGIGASIGGLIAAFSYRSLFVVDGGTSILAGFAILIFLGPAAGSKDTTDKPGADPLSSPWRNYHYLRFIAVVVLFSACFFIAFRTLPLFLKRSWGLTEANIGTIFGLNGLIIALCEMTLVTHLDRKGQPLKCIAAGAIIIGLSMLVLLMPGKASLLYAIVYVIIFSFGEMFALPFIDTYVSLQAAGGRQGLYAATYVLSFSLGQLFGPASGFLIAQQFGFAVLWSSMSFGLACCACCFYLLSKTSVKDVPRV